METGYEARLQPGDVRRLFIGGQDDLFPGVVKRIESVEKLLLQLFLAAELVNVVDQQDVHFAEIVAELEVGMEHGFVVQGVQIRVQELFAGHITDHRFRVVGDDMVCHSLNQMGLAHAGAAVNVKRIEYAGSRGGSHGGGIGITVFLADHEIPECESRLAIRRGDGNGGSFRYRRDCRNGFRAFILHMERLFQVAGFDAEFHRSARRCRQPFEEKKGKER